MLVEGATRVVVFDVNVYLDVAQLLGEPFTWYAFGERAGLEFGLPVPAPDPRIDSLRAIAYTLRGELAPGVRLEAWTSAHIDDLVELKARQPAESKLPPEERGLGWQPDAAAALVDDFVHGLVFEETHGGTCGDLEIAQGTPPLSHEDGLVMAAARCAGDGEIAARYCITRDVEFREAEGLPNDVQVMYPNEYVAMIRQIRLLEALRGLAPKPTS